MVLFDADHIKGDYNISDCAAETLSIECIVHLGWMAARAVSD